MSLTSTLARQETFGEWLLVQVDRHGPIGDLVKAEDQRAIGTPFVG